MREQVQADVHEFLDLAHKPAPKSGWINIIRRVLGMSSSQLAKRLGCSQSNVSSFERREKEGTITLKALNDVAQAMNCRLVYCLVPNKPFDELLEDQARLVAKRQLRSVSHSMKLEDQGLTAQQQKRQEDELVKDLLYGSLRNLWKDDTKV